MMKNLWEWKESVGKLSGEDENGNCIYMCEKFQRLFSTQPGRNWLEGAYIADPKAVLVRAYVNMKQYNLRLLRISSRVRWVVLLKKVKKVWRERMESCRLEVLFKDLLRHPLGMNDDYYDGQIRGAGKASLIQKTEASIYEMHQCRKVGRGGKRKENLSGWRKENKKNIIIGG